MDISGLLINLIRAELELPEAARQPFRVGEMLDLRVLEVISANRVRVDLGGFRTAADIQFPVAPGDKLQVEVTAVGRQLRLRPLTPSDSAAVRPPATLGPNTYYLSRYAEPVRQDIERILTQLQSDRAAATELPERILNALKAVAGHLKPLNPQGDVQILADRIKNRVESTGLFLEKKLEQIAAGVPKDGEKLPSEILQRTDRLFSGDLKAQLLVLKRYLEVPANALERLAADGAKRMNRAVAGMLSEIAGQQTDTRQTDPSQPFQVVLYDMPIRDGRKSGLLKMYFQKRRHGSDRRSFRLSLLLSLDRLGEIRSDFVLREKDLALMFFVARRRVRAHLESRLEQIRSKLRAYFPKVTVSVTLAEQKLLEFETDCLQVNGDKQIDMRV